MRYARITNRLQGKGGDKWAIHNLARQLRAQGADLIELTIGEPDLPMPPAIADAVKASIDAGRLGYSNGRGEAGLLAALSAKYSSRAGRAVGRDQIIALPGTQTALFAVLMALLDPDDEVLVGDPMYATYEGLIAATGATIVPVPLRPEAGFRMVPEDVAARITDRTRVLFLNSPHNPTGAVLGPKELDGLAQLALQHDLWIVSDEVYEEMVFPGTTFHSAFDRADIADRVVVTSSISKSHAAPGLRSGWAVGPADFASRLLPLAEAMLFGNQPFIADATALAVSARSPIAGEMALAFHRRAGIVQEMLHGRRNLRVHRPEAGMFALVDVRDTGLSGDAFARSLLREKLVAVMPGESFGAALGGWLRLSLTVEDADLAEACERIARFAARQQGSGA